ncbi:MAG: hypothetical protein DHS20C18_40750 [Saprospiraceae bacterium]|nr:MAG: hypothetical protein DHS20C18_40750 [Saprospiraceae bacterium]
MYKRRASILAINEGIDAIQQALSQNAWEVNWEGNRLLLSIEDMQMQEHHLRMLSTPKTYNLFKWLPFNNDNYRKWKDCANLSERIVLLERILASQLIAFVAAMNYRLPERLEVNLQNIQNMETVTCHGTQMVAFNVSYTANLLLPPHIAIGNSVSHGFGWQVPARINHRQAENKTKKEKKQLFLDNAL